MYLKSLKLKHVKLLREVTLDFGDPEGRPRMWTVLFGENGLCKSTILQCIALAASGPKLGSNLVRNAQGLRRAGASEPASIEATFVPSVPGGWANAPQFGDELSYRMEVRSDREDLVAASGSGAVAEELDGIRASRMSSGTSGWFVAGYGVGRFLPEAGQVAVPDNIRFDRVEGLFKKHHKMLGTDFYGALPTKQERLQFSRTLRKILLSRNHDERLFPMLDKVELRGKNGVTELGNLLESRRMDIVVGGKTLRLPATALSDGYQSMLAWIADLLGHAFLEHGASADPADLRGLVLLDEIDLHLHPRWQLQVVPLLRGVFPNLQFVATTHSPLVVARLDGPELVRLALEGDEVRADHAEPTPGLRTAGQLLDEYFDVPFAARPELIEKRRRLLELESAGRLSERDERSLKSLRAELEQQHWPTVSAPDPGDRA